MTYGAVDDGAVIAQAQHIEDSLALHKLKQTINNNPTNFCEECGTEIPSARLKAIPNAKYCIICQGYYDNNQTEFTCRNHYVP
jgi:phage/conjugal plasmid C-4 type zinc finger TraR family protein